MREKPISLFGLTAEDLDKRKSDSIVEHQWAPKEVKPYIEAYTDGGCHNNGKYRGIGAWAWFIKQDLLGDTYAGCSGRYDTTNNEMELMALKELLVYILTRYDIDTPIKIYSDSRYVVATINEAWYVSWLYNGWKNSDGMEVKNGDLWKEVIDLYNKFEKLELIHIRGHQGIYGNERCDKLCGEEIKRLIARRNI